MTALLTLVSGPLSQVFGASGFWLMAGLCAAALLVARRLPTVDTVAALPG